MAGTRRAVVVVATIALASAVGCSRDDDEATTTEAVDVGTALSRGEFGTIDDIGCGPAPEGETLEATESQGVSADAIEIGTVADPGNPISPGLGQELFDASEVFVEWCNSLGGINGRRIELNERDAAIFNYQAQIRDACQNDFALVGGGSSNDGVGQADRLTCLLPDVPGFTTIPEARDADLSVPAVPFPTDSIGFGIANFLTDEYPEANEKVGILRLNVPAGLQVTDQMRAAGESLGWEVVYDDVHNATGEPTYQPYAERIRDAGVRGLLYAGEPAVMSLLLQELSNIGYQLDWVIGPVGVYDQRLIDGAGQNLRSTPVYTWSESVPFENTDVPAMEHYKALFEQYKPDGKSTVSLALRSFSSWLLFAHAADACGVDLTRACLYDELQTVTSWDAGGLIAPTDPAEGEPSDCVVVIRATPEGFVPEEYKANTGPFYCDPSNTVATNTTAPDAGVTLEEVGLTLADLR